MERLEQTKRQREAERRQRELDAIAKEQVGCVALRHDLWFACCSVRPFNPAGRPMFLCRARALKRWPIPGASFFFEGPHPRVACYYFRCAFFWRPAM